MIRKMSKKQLLQRLEKLEKTAPKASPFIIFFNYLSDGTAEAVEHYGVGVAKQKDRLYTSVKQVRIVFQSQEELDEHYRNLDLSQCNIIMDDLDIED